MRLVERLRAEIASGPLSAARAVLATVATDMPDAGALVDDAAVDMPIRVAALLAIALAGQDGATIPDAAIAALEDDLLVDAVLASGESCAITGILAAAGDRASDRVRRYLALRLSAANASGIHVASLLLAIGDHEGAAHAAAPSFATGLRDRDEQDDVVLALARILVDWFDVERRFVERVVSQVPRGACAVLARAVRMLVGPDHLLAAVLEAQAAGSFVYGAGS